MKCGRALAAVALLLTGGQALAETMYARTSAVMRSDRTLTAETVARLQQGDAVEVSGREGGYCRVTAGGRVGWVYFNKLASEKPEDIVALLSAGPTGGIALAELEAGGALRGLSPMAESYAKAAKIPGWALRAVEQMGARKITAEDLERFQKQGGLGEYGGGASP